MNLMIGCFVFEFELKSIHSCSKWLQSKKITPNGIGAKGVSRNSMSPTSPTPTCHNMRWGHGFELLQFVSCGMPIFWGLFSSFVASWMFCFCCIVTRNPILSHGICFITFSVVQISDSPKRDNYNIWTHHEMPPHWIVWFSWSFARLRFSYKIGIS